MHLYVFVVVEENSCEFGSAKYYALCGFGGILSCGITHTAVVPLDLVKCRIQVDPGKLMGNIEGAKYMPLSVIRLAVFIRYLS